MSSNASTTPKRAPRARTVMISEASFRRRADIEDLRADVIYYVHSTGEAVYYAYSVDGVGFHYYDTREELLREHF